MRAGTSMLGTILLSSALLCGCGGSGTATSGTTPTATPTAAPGISTFSNIATQNGAVMVSLGYTTPGSVIYYSIDGSTPTSASQQYQAPFLVASNLTVKAIAVAPGDAPSTVTTMAFTPNIAPGALVWTDEFSNTTAANAQPNPATWTYDIGTNCCGNNEWENYCAWNSSVAPCNPSSPNAYVGTDGYLHIVAQQTTPATYAAGAFTSARLKTQGLFSFQYGRIEAHMMLPESQGMWPAFWLLGNNIVTSPWPACGELDVMEHIDGSNPPINGAGPGYDWIQSSIHGTNLNGGTPYTAKSFSAADWHTYGMIWTKGQIQFYIDTPSNIYETFTPNTQTGTWPFDQGPQFIILNLAVGGDWPGNPNSTTVFPSTMLVDYVHIYAN